MTKEEFIWILYNSNIGMQVHSLVIEDGVWKHIEDKCPKCVAEEILKIKSYTQ